MTGMRQGKKSYKRPRSLWELRLIRISGNEDVWKPIPEDEEQKGPAALLPIWQIQTAAVLTRLIVG